MQIGIIYPEKPESELEKSEIGQIVRFLDSGHGDQSIVDAHTRPGENFFMVFDDKEAPEGDKGLVSLDGELFVRRQNNRLVQVIKTKQSDEAISSKKMALSLVPPGGVISLGGQKGLCFVAKSNPIKTPKKVTLISFKGKKYLVDDDLLVPFYKDYLLLLEA